ncbi:TraV family lipoprotein, partial [Vibrio cyclitrophicus]
RTQDTVRKITIFPFTDTLGHYVDTTDIYVILDESRWSGRPANAIWKD